MAVFFDFDWIFSLLTTHGLFKSKIAISAGIPFSNDPALIPNIFAGFSVTHLIIVLRSKLPLWYCSKAKDKKVSIPDAPVAHFWKVSLFDSSSSGLWSETIMSITPFFMPSIKLILSSSFRRGGDSFKNVLNSPISFSFKDKWLIDTPVVKCNFLFFHSLMISSDLPDDSTEIWYFE